MDKPKHNLESLFIFCQCRNLIKLREAPTEIESDESLESYTWSEKDFFQALSKLGDLRPRTKQIRKLYLYEEEGKTLLTLYHFPNK